MLSHEVETNLLEMLDSSDDGIPDELIKRCGRIEKLIQMVKPDGFLISSQVLAMVVEQWERENQK
ncbi:hypothetical protein LCGC14_0248400 [marine sediment metagenome]|uniref:Uncharacterized protein n=1 Tax=marine sediment metagenome TaxID=412755 RepID=A0A0F9X9L4_9ZZZZ